MNYLAIMAIIDGVHQLNKQMIGIPLRKSPHRLALPEVIELAAFEVFHYDYQLLLLRQWQVI